MAVIHNEYRGADVEPPEPVRDSKHLVAFLHPKRMILLQVKTSDISACFNKQMF